MSVKDTTAVPVINKNASINRQTIAPKIASGHGLDVDDHKVTVGQSFSENAKMTMPSSLAPSKTPVAIGTPARRLPAN